MEILVIMWFISRNVQWLTQSTRVAQCKYWSYAHDTPDFSKKKKSCVQKSFAHPMTHQNHYNKIHLKNVTQPQVLWHHDIESMMTVTGMTARILKSFVQSQTLPLICRQPTKIPRTSKKRKILLLKGQCSSYWITRNSVILFYLKYIPWKSK